APASCWRWPLSSRRRSAGTRWGLQRPRFITHNPPPERKMDMHASIWKFTGDPDELLARHDAMLAEVPTDGFVAYLCLRAPDGILLVDTCRSQEAFEAFMTSDWVSDLRRRHGGPGTFSARARSRPRGAGARRHPQDGRRLTRAGRAQGRRPEEGGRAARRRGADDASAAQPQVPGADRTAGQCRSPGPHSG